MGTDTPPYPPSHVLISSWVSSQQSPKNRAHHHHHHHRLCEERAHDMWMVIGASEWPTSPLTRTLSRVSRFDQRRVEFPHLKLHLFDAYQVWVGVSCFFVVRGGTIFPLLWCQFSAGSFTGKSKDGASMRGRACTFFLDLSHFTFLFPTRILKFWLQLCCISKVTHSDAWHF